MTYTWLGHSHAVWKLQKSTYIAGRSVCLLWHLCIAVAPVFVSEICLAVLPVYPSQCRLLKTIVRYAHAKRPCFNALSALKRDRILRKTLLWVGL